MTSFGGGGALPNVAPTRCLHPLQLEEALSRELANGIFFHLGGYGPPRMTCETLSLGDAHGPQLSGALSVCGASDRGGSVQHRL